jgi:hypothetical protein
MRYVYSGFPTRPPIFTRHSSDSHMYVVFCVTVIIPWHIYSCHYSVAGMTPAGCGAGAGIGAEGIDPPSLDFDTRDFSPVMCSLVPVVWSRALPTVSY